MREINFPATSFALTKENLDNLLSFGIRMRLNVMDEEHEAYLVHEKNLLNMAPDSWYKSFIIVHEIIRRIKGIRPGCITAGRGTLSCSLIAYFLGLTDIDPVKFGLSCDRLYAMAKIKPMPDFDFDIAPSVMSDMYEILNFLFGEDNVFGCTVISKPGHKSAHACAVFLSDKPYTEYGNLFIGRHKTDLKILDRDRLECEALGLFKINLIKSQVAEELKNLVYETHNRMHAEDIVKMPEFFKSVSSTVNPFFARIDMNFYNNFSDLMFAFGRLYSKNTTIVTLKDKMTKHKIGISEVDKILKPTYGCLLYQEQINDILAYALDTDLINANVVRVDIQKENTENVNSYFCRFVEKLMSKGIDHMTICNLWAMINTHTNLTLQAHVTAVLYTIVEIEYLKSLC